MRFLVLSLALLFLLCSPAIAGRNANGAMVLHTDDAVNYSPGLDFCTVDPLPPLCMDYDTQVDKDPDIEAIVWMVATFPPGTSPGVNAFQVGIYGDIPGDYYTGWAPCGPGVLEIPDATWPAPGTGTACAFTSTVYETHFKMYWFAAAAPGTGSTLRTGPYPNGDHNAEWADDSNPAQIDVCTLFGTVGWGVPGHDDCNDTPHPGACCFGCDCRQLMPDECTAQGGYFLGSEVPCDPNPCFCPVGACCIGGVCEMLIQTECENAGGVWLGPDVDCSSFPCGQTSGACCFCDGNCRVLTEVDCVNSGGSYMGDGVPCDPNPCPAGLYGACCLGDQCVETTQQCCYGIWQGDGTVCDPNPCHPDPTKPTTWGRIKAGYR
jgi:hypothetical protein